MVALASPLVLTIPEAAEALGISRAKAYSLARDGQLPTVHFGRAVRVPIEALRALLSARGVRSALTRIKQGDTKPVVASSKATSAGEGQP